MKKLFLLTLLSILFTFSSYSQTSKWGVSYAAEFMKYDISPTNIGNLDGKFTIHNLNIHYSLLDWSNDFQIGPLVSYRFLTQDGETNGDFQVGLNLGYNMGKVAIVVDTYKVFDSSIDDHNIFIIKPALEYSFSGNVALALGYSKFLYGGSYSKQFNTFKAGGLLLGVKYKF